MTNSKNTKRALLASILSVVLCCAMLVGSTFAWFTDSVTSAGNIIKSGTLDVTMVWADGTQSLTDSATEWKDAAEGAIFNYDLWEPGYTEVRHVKISNVGSLALKYEIRITATGEVSELADVIDVYYIKNGRQIANRTDLTDAEKIGTLADVLANPYAAKGHISGKTDEVVSSDIATIALKMQEDAGNKYQDMSIGSEFAIQLVATQYTEESDSFDNQYDKDAEYPIVSNSAFSDALAAGGNVVLGSDVNLDDNITKDVNINLNGNTIAPTHSRELKGGADLSMSNGNYVFENSVSFGHIDVRPGSTTDSVVSFENVVFTSKKLNKTYGPCTDRVESVVEFTPETGGKTTFLFKNCTFNNAQVVFEGMSGRNGFFTATFENCTFNNLGTSAGIYAQNYLDGTITVKDCAFNYTATASASAVGTQSATVTINFEGTNTVYGEAATAYTYNPENGEDETYNIKVMTPSVKAVSVGSHTTVNGLDTVVVSGIASK